MSEVAAQSDVWSSWLLRHRHGGDPLHEQMLQSQLVRYADRVLDGLQLEPGRTLLDVGTGDGLVTFRAIDRVGPELRVVLTDISAAMLRHVEIQATHRGILPQCSFVEGSADRLDGVADASIDGVATRAVLAYVADRRSALLEFLRVLRPGGAISIAEPMMQDDAMNAIMLRRIVESKESNPQRDVISLLHRWKAAQFPDTLEQMAKNPLVNYSERDLVTLFQECGFEEIHLELHIDVRRCDGMPWETFLSSSPHPLAPPLRQTLEEQFDPEGREAFERLLRPAVESGVSNSVERVVYLTARKPDAEHG